MGLIDINGKQIDNSGVKMMDEKTYRFRLMEEAKHKGCAKELQQLFDKFDALLRNCTNQQEREHIGMLGVLEVSKLIDGGYVGKGGSLIVNGQVIIADEDDSK